VSAGSIAALQMAFGEESDRPASTYTNPDLGCTDCSGNSYNHSSSNVKALVNCWGAMGDVNWIEPGEDVPIISFHGDQDLIVPYDSGYPFVALASMPYVYGSLPISQRADTVGLYNEFYTFAGVGHNVWGTIINNSFSGGPTAYFRPILHSTSDFLFRFIKPDTGPITGDTAVCFGDTITYSVVNTANATYCWTVNGGSIVSADTLNSSIDVSWEVAAANGLSVVEGNTFLAAGDTQTYFVQVYPPPTASAGVDTTICEGSTHTLAGTIGGTATTLLWTSSGDGIFDDSSLAAAAYTPGPLDIAAGTVNLSIATDDPTGLCGAATDDMTLVINPLPTVSVVGGLNMCAGDTVTISGSGATTYQWSPTLGLEDPMAGTTNAYPGTTTAYTLNGTDASGCTGQDTLTITVVALPSAIIQEVNDTLITSQGLVYQWYLNGTLLSGETVYFLATPISGNYTVLITDSNNCQSLSAPYSYSHISISPVQGRNTVSIYPNPNSGYFKIKVPTEHKYGIQEIIITDVLGRQVYRKRLAENNSSIYQHSLNIGFLPTGTYIAVINTGADTVFKKILIH
jgi:hypothetical protein